MRLVSTLIQVLHHPVIGPSVTDKIRDWSSRLKDDICELSTHNADQANNFLTVEVGMMHLLCVTIKTTNNML